MKKSSPFRIVITTGDQDGIGLEITYKALAKIGPVSGVSFVVCRGTKTISSLQKSVSKKFNFLTASSLDEALSLKNSSKTLIEIVHDSELPPHWVAAAAQAALEGKVAALVNAPLSKTSIQSAGFKAMGHTEILSQITKTSSLTMSFWGPHFSVALGSTHISLKDVSAQTSKESLSLHLRNVANYFPRKSSRKFRIGVLGMNPHAGEAGLLGKEETYLFSEVLSQLRKEFPRVSFSDPLVPDAAFLPQVRKSFDILFCVYHDQGLIPFKMLHEQSRGCQITLGLPFVRTSVDHGTAKDLFGKNKANPGSMIDAIKMALSLVKSQRRS